MAFTFKSNSDILSSVLRELRTTGINYTHRSSKAYALASSIVRELDIAQKFFDSNFDAAFLRNASNEFLEALGELFGVRRRQPSKCTSFASEQNVIFFVSNGGTFGSINSGNSITIPAGTIIQTAPLVDIQDPIQYEVVSAVTLGASETQIAVSVSSILEGSGSRVGPRTLGVHDFTDYTQVIADSLKVINVYPIINGEDKQTDAEYRFLIAQAARAHQAGNITAMRFAALSVPGVVDTRIINYFDGIGTVGVFIVGQDNMSSPTLANAVQAQLALYQSNGILATAYEPPQVGVSFVTKVNTTTPLSVNAKNELKQSLINITRNYITSLRIGDVLDMQVLQGLLLKADSRITSFGSVSSKFFDELGIWRLSLASTENDRVRSEALDQSVIRIEPHEIIIPESSITNAINFTF